MRGRRTYIVAALLAGVAAAEHIWPQYAPLWATLRDLLIAGAVVAIRLALPVRRVA